MPEQAICWIHLSCALSVLVCLYRFVGLQIAWKIGKIVNFLFSGVCFHCTNQSGEKLALSTHNPPVDVKLLTSFGDVLTKKKVIFWYMIMIDIKLLKNNIEYEIFSTLCKGWQRCSRSQSMIFHDNCCCCCKNANNFHFHFHFEICLNELKNVWNITTWWSCVRKKFVMKKVRVMNMGIDTHIKWYLAYPAVGQALALAFVRVLSGYTCKSQTWKSPFGPWRDMGGTRPTACI